MLRQVIKQVAKYRHSSVISIRSVSIIQDVDLEKPGPKQTINSNSKEPVKCVDAKAMHNENIPQLIKETVSIHSLSDDKPVTAQPFAELNQSAENSLSEISEFIDSLGPPLPIAFNLAAYANQSESLQKLVQLGVDLYAIEKKPDHAKYILKLDFEKDMKEHIKFLHDIGIEADMLGRFITKNPLIFKESIENLKIRINYFKSKNFSSDAISRILGNNPFILSMSTKQVDTRLGLLQKQFLLSGDEVRFLVAKSPKLVTYNSNKFLEKLFVMKEEIGLKFPEMKRLLLNKPKVWILGRKQLTERFLYVHNIMGISHEQIVSCPSVLLTRLFILTHRHQYLVHLGRAQYDPTQPMYVSLDDLATSSDSVFCEKCAKTSVQEYNEFLKSL